MTQPTTAPARAARDHRAFPLPRPLSAHRFAGRWPATDQLVNSTTPPVTSTTGRPGTPAAGPVITDTTVASHLDQQAQQQTLNAAAALGRGEAGLALRGHETPEVQTTKRRDISREPQPDFIERIATITEQFTSPSTGETSVDRPLATIVEHETDYEYEGPDRHHMQSGLRL